MTIDERLEALTMNLELTARDVADLQKATAAMQVANAEFQRKTDEFRQATDEFRQATEVRFARWELEKQHLDEKVDTIVESTKMLLIAVQSQQVRLEKVERRVS